MAASHCYMFMSSPRTRISFSLSGVWVLQRPGTIDKHVSAYWYGEAACPLFVAVLLCKTRFLGCLEKKCNEPDLTSTHGIILRDSPSPTGQGLDA